MNEHYLTELNAIEARILGCLMEKQLTTPDQYPLTQNALLSACNQKTNRNPIMSLMQGELGHELMQMANAEWIRVEQGSRSDRYQQRCSVKFKLTPAEQAIVCILILRGPQTLNELVARTVRMIQDNENALLDALESLMSRDQPIILQLDKQTGQREDRYGQLIYDQGGLISNAIKTTPKVVEIHHPDSERITALEEQVAELKKQVSSLIEQQSLKE